MNESLSELRTPEVDWMNGDVAMLTGAALIVATLAIGMLVVWIVERKTKRAVK